MTDIKTEYAAIRAEQNKLNATVERLLADGKVSEQAREQVRACSARQSELAEMTKALNLTVAS